ncbi:hypothetical protein PIB30_034520 [Stylosanthes scabra]|uniref:Uncharacterized protein n=1 Tax=Stylosanthes scabra TaxID=79078 RepID=A0ABU6QC87_9FABA|nr:hypothetical protein [Stylosanthes scabra]
MEDHLDSSKITAQFIIDDTKKTTTESETYKTWMARSIYVRHLEEQSEEDLVEEVEEAEIIEEEDSISIIQDLNANFVAGNVMAELRFDSRVASELIWHYSLLPSVAITSTPKLRLAHCLRLREDLSFLYVSTLALRNVLAWARAKNHHPCGRTKMLIEAKGEVDEVIASLRMPLGAMGMNGCVWMINGAVEPRTNTLSLEFRYGLGLVIVKVNLAR